MKKIKDFLRALMLLYKRLLYFVARITSKIDEKTVFFEAFQGRSVACSPKALYEEMLRNPHYSEFTLIWSLRDTDREDMSQAQRVQLVKFESYRYYKALATAKYWIFNSNPRPFLKPGRKRIFVQTWHGTPLKKIGCDVTKSGNAMTKVSDIQKIYTTEAKKITFMISPSEYCTEKFISAFHLKEEKKENCVLTTGYPRNDYLYRVTDKEIENLKEEFGIKKDKKVVLYAPTFRDNKYSAKEGFRLENHLDFDKARETLGDDYIILFRAHYFISQKIDFSNYRGFVIDVSKVEDVNQLYVISDVLITDYSSVFFDYANLKRPIIFFMSDYEEYKNQLRDFYLDIKELPGKVTREQEEVFEAIKEVSDNFVPDEKYREFNSKFNYLDGPDTSRKVLERIIENAVVGE